VTKNEKSAKTGRRKAGRSRGSVDKDEPSKVVSIEQWKNRSRAIAAPVEREKLSAEAIPFLPRAQKAVFLLKYILSDETTDQELDELLMSAATPPG
jgi:hypothetical protein